MHSKYYILNHTPCQEPGKYVTYFMYVDAENMQGFGGGKEDFLGLRGRRGTEYNKEIYHEKSDEKG